MTSLTLFFETSTNLVFMRQISLVSVTGGFGVGVTTGGTMISSGKVGLDAPPQRFILNLPI